MSLFIIITSIQLIELPAFLDLLQNPSPYCCIAFLNGDSGGNFKSEKNIEKSTNHKRRGAAGYRI
jgi:hypothetical protein